MLRAGQVIDAFTRKRGNVGRADWRGVDERCGPAPVLVTRVDVEDLGSMIGIGEMG